MLITGEYRFLRADILHDVGHSINPAIDLGQAGCIYSRSRMVNNGGIVVG